MHIDPQRRPTKLRNPLSAARGDSSHAGELSSRAEANTMQMVSKASARRCVVKTAGSLLKLTTFTIKNLSAAGDL
jgi:hypothetical protein